MHADLGRVQRLLGLACLGLLLLELLRELDNFRFGVLGLLLQRSHQLAMVVAEGRRHDGHLDAEQAVLVCAGDATKKEYPSGVAFAAI